MTTVRHGVTFGCYSGLCRGSNRFFCFVCLVGGVETGTNVVVLVLGTFESQLSFPEPRDRRKVSSTFCDSYENPCVRRGWKGKDICFFNGFTFDRGNRKNSFLLLHLIGSKNKVHHSLVSFWVRKEVTGYVKTGVVVNPDRIWLQIKLKY